jgi:hypothetical protein
MIDCFSSTVSGLMIHTVRQPMTDLQLHSAAAHVRCRPQRRLTFLGNWLERLGEDAQRLYLKLYSLANRPGTRYGSLAIPRVDIPEHRQASDNRHTKIVLLLIISTIRVDPGANHSLGGGCGTNVLFLRSWVSWLFGCVSGWKPQQWKLSNLLVVAL